MMSKFESKIIIDAADKTRSIFDSVNTDNNFYPENPTKTKINLSDKLEINIESNHLPHFRANLNSTLRLVQASNDSIDSAKV